MFKIGSLQLVMYVRGTKPPYWRAADAERKLPVYNNDVSSPLLAAKGLLTSSTKNRKSLSIKCIRVD